MLSPTGKAASISSIRVIGSASQPPQAIMASGPILVPILPTIRPAEPTFSSMPKFLTGLPTISLSQPVGATFSIIILLVKCAPDRLGMVSNIFDFSRSVSMGDFGTYEARQERTNVGKGQSV